MDPLFSKRAKLVALLIIVLVLSLIVGSGFTRNQTSKSPEIFDSLQLFAEVLSKVQNNYVEEVKPKQLVYGAIRGMISTLDPYSQFMDTDAYQELESDTKGEFGGLGIRIIMGTDNVLTVESPMEGTPAFKAGIKAKDKIIKIDNDTTEKITLEQAVKKLRGPKGTQVRLEIFRAGNKEPLVFNLTRDIIIVESIRSKVLDVGMKIGYIRISEFREKTGTDLADALAKMKKEGVQALILDLRYNPGGLLKSSVDVSDLFLPKDKIVVSTKGRAPGQDTEYKTSDRSEKYTTIPMVCLVNEGSASASEIVAGALQDYKRAILIGHSGKRTFGKGSVQSVMELRDNTALRLTTAKYYTPNNRSIHGQGIMADINVEIPREVEDSLLFAGKLGDLTVPKAYRTILDDSTMRYVASDTETVADVQLEAGIKALKTPEYFKQPGVVDVPPSNDTTTVYVSGQEALKQMAILSANTADVKVNKKNNK